MRLALRIDLISRRAPFFAICAALAFSALPASAGTPTAQAAPAQFATLTDSSDAADPACASLQATTPVAAEDDSQIAANPSTPTADAASMNDFSLDDQMLSRQRGGAVGMLMVAATPQLTQSGGNQVTLWDEIAPPSPLPVPVDAARAAQGNVATYQRK
ncbi:MULTISPECIES: hypothetical protein [unclassified Paraburkholderia]|uniref:hypothetical protein n=1 Tax=unclassified Paraburkholderia TaxID=2615204 RepID=UPI00160DBC20|nr:MULTISPECIES: hypothetical protein [unclassified Paraburkholderia]MBB5443308.1 hypothetical protein [Paraburkholderia sp. WSM4177]MBB5484471.1 hypothetical protein [Paraburkholderia sp. WSM4180]